MDSILKVPLGSSEDKIKKDILFHQNFKKENQDSQLLML